MQIPKAAILIAVLCAAPNLAVAEDHPSRSSAPSCGWKGGSLPDPADTQRCLAEHFKPPKPKPPQARAPSPPAANTVGPASG